MKKILSALITMAIILSVSSCGGSAPEATTTSAESTVSTTGGAGEVNADIKAETEAATESTETEEPAETETTTEPSETEESAEITEPEKTEEPEETEKPAEITAETTAETSAETTAETNAPEGELLNNAFLDGLKDKSPLYYEFGKITSTIPCTLTMTVMDGENESGTMTMCMTSLQRVAVCTDLQGQSARIVLDNGKYYIISDNEETIIYYPLSGEEIEAMAEEMANSVQVGTAFDFDKAEFTSGTEEFMGETFKYETVDDGTTDVKLYFDSETGKTRYMVSAGQTVRIDDYHTGADESLFDIPENYETMDLETLMGEITATE